MPSPTDHRRPAAPVLVIAAVDLHPDTLALLQRHARVVQVGSGGLRTATSDDLTAATAILVNSKSRVDADLMDRTPALRIVATQSIGFDHIDVAAATSRCIEVSTAPNRREALAAIVISLMLMLSRNLFQAVAQVRSGDWSTGISGTDLDRRILFLVGFGGTARAVVAKALAFDMQVIAFDVRPPADVPPGVRLVDTMEQGLREADWVSVHVDLNPHTRHLIGAAQLEQMKPTAYLINTSRGPVVDQAALAAALTAGTIAGAGLDVLEVEPPRPDDPILDAPNVVITPHIGFATREIQYDMQRCAAETIIERTAGRASDYVLPSTRRPEQEHADD